MGASTLPICFDFNHGNGAHGHFTLCMVEAPIFDQTSIDNLQGTGILT